jgi:SPP1 family predicted phage head-tail adaptor
VTQLGQYDKRVAFLKRSDGRDPEGQPLVGAGAWTEVGGAWANIRFQSGLEAIRSDAVTNLVAASIRIQGRPNVTEKMRVRYGAMIFEITSVVPDDRQEHFDLVCQLVR